MLLFITRVTHGMLENTLIVGDVIVAVTFVVWRKVHIVPFRLPFVLSDIPGQIFSGFPGTLAFPWSQIKSLLPAISSVHKGSRLNKARPFKNPYKTFDCVRFLSITFSSHYSAVTQQSPNVRSSDCKGQEGLSDVTIHIENSTHLTTWRYFIHCHISAKERKILTLQSAPRRKQSIYATWTSPIMHFSCAPQILHNLGFSFLLGITVAPREIENNTYAKFLRANKVHYGRCASGVWPRKEGLNGVTRPKIKSIAVKNGKF